MFTWRAVESLVTSFLAGGLLQGVLGEKALQGSNVMVHPFLVAGWAGLVSTSLNLLPVGSIDGGRIVQVCLCFSMAWSNACVTAYAVPAWPHDLGRSALATCGS